MIAEFRVACLIGPWDLRLYAIIEGVPHLLLGCDSILASGLSFVFFSLDCQLRLLISSYDHVNPQFMFVIK